MGSWCGLGAMLSLASADLLPGGLGAWLLVEIGPTDQQGVLGVGHLDSRHYH